MVGRARAAVAKNATGGFMSRQFISRRRGALACAMLVATLALAGSARAGDRVVTSSSVIRLVGSLYDSNTDSYVTLRGWVHLVTTVQFPNDQIQPILIDAYVNLPAIDVEAVNQNPTYANLRYLAYGAANTKVQWSYPNPDVPPNPILPSGFVLRLVPPNPITPQGVPPNPIRFGLRVHLSFNLLEVDSGLSYAEVLPQ